EIPRKSSKASGSGSSGFNTLDDDSSHLKPSSPNSTTSDGGVSTCVRHRRFVPCHGWHV
ncbi:unnamed protein product, partial [Orchesella dallaii]